MRRIAMLIVGLAVLGLSACAGTQDAPAQAVESYLEALTAKDFDRVINLSCAEWEEGATVEVDSLEAVTARLEGVTCRSVGTDSGYTLVDCSGNIVLSYNGEDRSLDLGRRTYRVVQQGGLWLMCGYQE